MDSPMTLLLVLAIVAIVYLMWTGREVHGHAIEETPIIPLVPVSPPASQQEGDQPTEKKDVKVVLFFAPWCGHCKNVVPIWDVLGQKYRNVVKIDCDSNPQVASEHGVQGFPTIRAYVNNDFVEYNGDRSAQSLESFVVQYQ
jgi:protein disulfide-isomerase A6